MLEDFAGQDEVVTAELALVGTGYVEARLSIVEGVAVVEAGSEEVGVLDAVAHAEAAKTLHAGEFGGGEREAVQLHRERVEEAAHADVGSRMRNNSGARGRRGPRRSSERRRRCS